MAKKIWLEDHHTTEELIKMIRDIENNPANKNLAGSLQIYTKQAQKKLDRLAEAITRKLAAARALVGNPVPTAGYSGRQSNK